MVESWDMDDVVREFLVTCFESLDQMEQDLLQCERNPGDRDSIARVFRTIHSIKGSCGFLGFARLEEVTHAGENLLGKLRDGDLPLTRAATDALFQLVDVVRGILAAIERDRSEGKTDHAPLIATIASLCEGDGSSSSEATERFSEEITTVKPVGELLIESGEVNPSAVASAMRQQAKGDSRPLCEILVERGDLDRHQASETLGRQERDRAARRAIEGTVRVDVDLLDRLMGLVEELVLARSQILQVADTQSDPALRGACRRLYQVTADLQECVLNTRMQPIGHVWGVFPRTVHDLAASCGKRVRIAFDGDDTELDRVLIEAIRDPLTHLVRNAVDHGIEAPDVRAANGKPEEGMLLLRAFHEGGEVVIEIRDDGAGISTKRIRQRAIDEGLVAAPQAERMSEGEVLDLLFLPGFTTAERITHVSGRGVGMDVVKSNIERIGGTAEIESAAGQGATVRLRVPLTLAIIPALLVTAGGEQFAIPQESVVEIAEADCEGSHSAGALPLVKVSAVLGLEGTSAGDSPNHSVCLQAGGQRFGLVVDEIHGAQGIVVKPLSGPRADVTVFSGATVGDDGQSVPILNVAALAQHAQGFPPEIPAGNLEI